MGWHVCPFLFFWFHLFTQPLCRNPIPILSRDSEVFVLLAGRPTDVSYLEDLKSLELSMHHARENLGFAEDHLKHRRGNYPIQSTGISYGGGSKVIPPLWFFSIILIIRSPSGSWGP